MSGTQWRGGTSPRDTSATALGQTKKRKRKKQNVWLSLTNGCPLPPLVRRERGRGGGVSRLAKIVFEKE